MANTNTNIADSPDARADWELAGEAWAHAAIDWAYRHALGRADDGSYRLVNELTHPIARKPATSEAVR